MWIALSTSVAAVAAALSGISVARINATKVDVGKAREQAGKAHEQAQAANEAAVLARDYSAQTGNGYTDESRAAWKRIEKQLGELTDRQVRTNNWLTRHLADHAQANLNQKERDDG